MARISADQRRELLVEAAIRVMVRDGVAKATTRAIVAEADMTLGVFHYCFRSKEELLETVIETITSHTLAPAMDVVAKHRSLRGAVRASLQAYWDHVQANPDEHLVTYELTQYALREPRFAPVARRQYEHYLETNTEFLESLARAAKIEWTVPVPVLARYVLSVLDGLTLNWLLGRDDERAAAVLDEFAEHVRKLARRRRG